MDARGMPTSVRHPAAMVRRAPKNASPTLIAGNTWPAMTRDSEQMVVTTQYCQTVWPTELCGVLSYGKAKSADRYKPDGLITLRVYICLLRTATVMAPTT